MAGDEAAEVANLIRRELEDAAEAILAIAEAGLAQVAAAKAGSPTALGALEKLLSGLMETCAFQDLVGQRLTQLERIIQCAQPQPYDPEQLLNGPARSGEGLDQAAADALMAQLPPPSV